MYIFQNNETKIFLIGIIFHKLYKYIKNIHKFKKYLFKNISKKIIKKIVAVVKEKMKKKMAEQNFILMS